MSFLYITDNSFDFLTIEKKPKRREVYGHEKGEILYGRWINSDCLACCSSIQTALAIESLRTEASLKSVLVLMSLALGVNDHWHRMATQLIPLCHTCRSMSGKTLLCTTGASRPWLSRTQSAWAFCTNLTEAQTCGSSTIAFWRMAACTSTLAFAPPRPQVWT